MFKLKRYNPTEIEIEITPNQLVSMFPIEIQEHPFMGKIERVWQTDDKTYSIRTIEEDFIIDKSSKNLHKIVKTEKMLEILSNLKNFQIILFYEDKKDIYDVKKLS